MSDTHNDEYADDQPGDSPGELLRRERERQGIALRDAAHALHLRPAVVSGLEQDHYAEIPVATYRRGYLRTYARYLGMDDAPVLRAYEARHGAPDTARDIKPVSVTRPPSRLGGILFKLVTLLVIAGLIGVTVTWWQSRGGNAPPSLDDGAVTAPDSSAAAETSSSTDDATDEIDAAAKSAAETTANADSAAEADSVQNSVETGSADTAPAAPSDSALAAATRVAGADEAEDSSADADSGADATTLALTFNQQSWTEIFDAHDERVFVGLQQPGTEASVEGQPPFRLTVGNATGVELRYRGEVVDLARHAGANNVARFTLGE
ncbi:RodZ domain-containing protein [Halomonas garicola]|uniref:RodZ domain-containing protein n=1 Tax=Halomonas garicola TaxID=1690008 RepID=UPI002899DBCA|nr:RodZ domain-containing protein [Halomonas garicola]